MPANLPIVYFQNCYWRRIAVRREIGSLGQGSSGIPKLNQPVPVSSPHPDIISLPLTPDIVTLLPQPQGLILT